MNFVKSCLCVAVCTSFFSISVFKNINAAGVISRGTKMELSKKNKKTECKENSDERIVSNKLLNYSQKFLDNGLQVIVVPDKLVPRVSVGVVYKVGCADDPKDLYGLSHMTEHMFFLGSEKYASPDKAISEVGGYTNACTCYDFTMYTSDCPAKYLPLILDIEADRMANFNLAKKEKLFQNEQQAVMEERMMRVENLPLGIEEEYIKTALYPQHPYGLELVGSRRNIESYTIEAIMEHYKKWYMPNNAAIVVVGDVEVEEVFSLVEKYFGKIKARKIPARIREKNAITKGIQHEITLYTDKVSSPKVVFCYNLPDQPNGREKYEKECAIDIGLKILSDGVVFEFSRYFIDKKFLVSSIDYAHYGPTLEPYPILITSSLMPNISAEKFKKEFFKKITDLQKNGIDKREFEMAKKNYLNNLAYKTLESHEKIRMFLCECLVSERPLSYINNIYEIADSITQEMVNEALNRFFSSYHFATITYLPQKLQN